MIPRAEYDGSIRIGTKIDTKGLEDGLKSVVRSAKTAASSTARILGNIMRPTVGFVKGIFQGMREELQGSKIKKNVDGLGKAMAGLAKRLVIFQLLRQAFSALAREAKEAFSSYLAADKDLGNSVRNLQASLKTLYGSLASAFAPIVEVVVPYLSTMVNWLIAGANAVAQFTAALMGKSVYKKASANIAATGAAAGSAANAVDKLNKKLGAYDDLKTIDQDNGSGGSGGGGGGGASGGGIEYEDVDIDSGISGFADKVKKAWEEADFTEIGTIVGTKLKTALDNINWEGIKATTEKMAKSIATFLNGFIATPGLFNSIGSTIAEGLNTAMTFASTFLNTFDFKQFGKAITEGIGGFFSTFSWSTLASVLQGWADAGLKYITGIIQGVDWKNLPQNIIKAIKDFFSGFDFAAHFQAVGEFIGSAVAAGIDLIGAIGKVIGDIGKKIKDYFVEKIQAAGYSSDATLAENGKAIIVGIFNGIVDFFKGIGAWINTNILQPFITGFKSIFGIHSPADNSQITSLGTNIIEGIFGAIITWFGNIKQWITDNVFNKFKDGWKAVFGEGGLVDTAVSIAVGVVEDAKNWVADAWTALSSAGKTLTSTVKAALEKAKTWAADAWTALGNAGKTVTATVATALEKAKDWADDAWSAITSAGKTITTTVKAAVEKASTWASDAWNAMQAGGKTLITTISAAVEQAKNWSSVAWSAITAGGKTLATTISTAVDKAKTWVADAWSAIQAGGKSVTATISAAVQQAKSWSSVAWSAITAGGKTLAATVSTIVEQAKSWSSVAWSAISAGGKTLTTTVSAAVNQAKTWVADAWSAICAGGKNLVATIASAVEKGTWDSDAWTAINKGGGKVTRTLIQGVKKAKTFIASALEAAQIAGGTISRTLKQSVIKGSWYSSAVSMVYKGADTIVRTLKQSVEKGGSWVEDAFIAATKLGGTIYRTLSVTAAKSGSGTAWKLLDDYYSRHANGGAFFGGSWHNIAQYATGGIPRHGTIFAAGEAGAEVVGHIGGRTEVLNQSQMAAVMYSSVVNGMAAAIGAVMGHMTECTNAIIANIAFLVESMDYVASAMPAYAGITTGFVPDINRTSGALSGGVGLDALAAAVADRISGNIQIENVMNMDGRAVYRGMVEIDRQTIRQTGRSAFGG